MRSLGALPPRMLPSVGESYSIRWHQLDVDESVPSAYRSSGIVRQDRKSTRLNSSHSQISYAVFCLKKKHDRDDDGDRDRDSGRNRWRGRLSAGDQSRFDSYYTRWLQYRRDNNREQISSMEKRMWDLMDHNNIPREVPFGEIASRR